MDKLDTANTKDRKRKRQLKTKTKTNKAGVVGKKLRKMTSASQLQEIEETISNVASQQGNDSDSSYVDVNEVGDDDDVTGPADRTAHV